MPACLPEQFMANGVGPASGADHGVPGLFVQRPEGGVCSADSVQADGGQDATDAVRGGTPPRSARRRPGPPAPVAAADRPATCRRSAAACSSSGDTSAPTPIRATRPGSRRARDGHPAVVQALHVPAPNDLDQGRIVVERGGHLRDFTPGADVEPDLRIDQRLLRGGDPVDRQRRADRTLRFTRPSATGSELVVASGAADETHRPTVEFQGAPTAGSASMLPSRCNRTSRRGGRPSVCTRATVS